MSKTSLDIPDDLSEQSEHAHSPTVAVALTDAYARLALNRYDEAEQRILPYEHWPISKRQRMRIYYVRAMARIHLRHPNTALAFLDEALHEALSLDELGACAQLAYLQGATYHESSDFTHAAIACDLALSAWEAFLADSGPLDEPDTAFTIDILDVLGMAAFLLGRYNDARTHLQLARRLIPLLPAPRSALRAAGLEWTVALVHRWQGDAAQALTHSLNAFRVYDETDQTGELARLRIVIADVLMDLCANMGKGRLNETRNNMLGSVGEHVLHALAHTSATNDHAGKGMALLTYVRYNRAISGNEDRLSVIASVERMAGEIGDMNLLGQVHTARGDEFSALGEAGSARQCYVQALDVFAKSDAAALAIWPRRALWRDSEMRTDS